MEKFANFLFLLWIGLAIACFVGAFFITPTWVKVISVVFGILNMAIIMSWTRASIQAIKENNKKEKEEI